MLSKLVSAVEPPSKYNPVDPRIPRVIDPPKKANKNNNNTKLPLECQNQMYPTKIKIPPPTQNTTLKNQNATPLPQNKIMPQKN